jgi:hypothetical protein
MALRKKTETLTATGEAGAATATGSINLLGVHRVHAVALKYAGLPATTDVSIVDGGSSLNTPLVQANSNTSKMHYPVVAASKGADGTASTLTEVAPLAESLKVTLAQGDPGGTLEVTAYYETS